MRLLPLLSLVATAGSPLAAQRSRTVIVIPGQLTQVVTDTMGTAYEVPYPTGRVYEAVLAAFKELKIPSEVRDSAGGRVETTLAD